MSVTEATSLKSLLIWYAKTESPRYGDHIKEALRKIPSPWQRYQVLESAMKVASEEIASSGVLMKFTSEQLMKKLKIATDSPPLDPSEVQYPPPSDLSLSPREAFGKALADSAASSFSHPSQSFSNPIDTIVSLIVHGDQEGADQMISELASKKKRECFEDAINMKVLETSGHLQGSEVQEIRNNLPSLAFYLDEVRLEVALALANQGNHEEAHLLTHRIVTPDLRRGLPSPSNQPAPTVPAGQLVS